MPSALDLLFESEISGRLIRFLRSRGERTLIVAPHWVRQRVEAAAPRGNSAARAKWIHDPADPALQTGESSKFIVIAEDVAGERATINSLRLCTESSAYGLFGHILPALLCHAKAIVRSPPVRPLKKYAILCLPRSGSRYLALTLSNAGVGAPREHIREPFATVITRGKAGFAASMGALEQFGQANGIFGTKLISTFLIDASWADFSILGRNVEWMAKRGYHFILLNRALADSVVSSYIASRLRQWHFFHAVDHETRYKLDTMPFDEDAMWEEYIRFVADRIIIDHLAGMHAMTTFEYAAIRDRADDVAAWLCERMQVDASGLPRASARLPTVVHDQSSTYAVFGQRLNALIDVRRRRLVENATERLCERTGLPRNTAEKLAYVHSSAFAP